MYKVNYETIEPMPPTQTYHIIWNLLLADKQMKLTQEILDAEKICHIVAILPHESDFLKLNADIKSFPYTVLEYGDSHNTTIDRNQFDKCCSFINEKAKNKNGIRNVLIFCNNGYQRSIPFLTYYLTNFHSDEVPTIEKALTIILSQVDRENYSQVMPRMVENITSLLL